MLRRTTTKGMVVLLTVLAVSACGSSKKYANQNRPPVPVNLTVYINDSKVSVSPASVGAGPVVFEVTNQASRAESVAIVPAGGGGGQPLASTGPINPQATAQVAVNFNSAGTYRVTTSGGGAADASISAPTAIQAAQVQVGAPRPGSRNELMTP